LNEINVGHWLAGFSSSLKAFGGSVLASPRQDLSLGGIWGRGENISPRLVPQRAARHSPGCTGDGDRFYLVTRVL